MRFNLRFRHLKVKVWSLHGSIFSHGINHSRQLFLLQQSQHSEGGKDDIMLTNNIKSNKVRSLFGLHSLMWCYVNTKIRLSHLRCLKVTCLKVTCPVKVSGLGSLLSRWREVGVSRRWLGEASSFGSTFEDVVCTTCSLRLRQPTVNRMWQPPVKTVVEFYSRFYLP